MSLIGIKNRALASGEIALRDEASEISWAQLDSLLNRSVNALLAMELGRDRRVAVYAENSLNTVVAYLTEILAG